MNLRRLRHFLAVYEHGSLGRAAEGLHLTQPALSKSVQQLESSLDVKLFDRTPAGVVPTIFGDTLSMHAKVIESEIRNAEREIATLRGGTKGEITVGVTPSIAANIMPNTVLKLHAEKPGIRVRIVEGLLEAHIPTLRRGELDLVVASWSRGMHADLATEILMRDRVLVWAGAGHPLAGKKVPVDALVPYPWVMPPSTQFWMTVLDRHFVTAGLSPPSADVVTNSAAFIKEMLLENRHLSFLPEQLLKRQARQGRMVPVQVEGLSVDIDVSVCYRDRTAHPAAFNAFMTMLKTVCRQG
ncbi:MAG: LysR family transcriptional regulator [Gammaproteobacteria bacterium]|nr:LysR family transcriptional regulator [Gammaproteobacteria bacterium]